MKSFAALFVAAAVQQAAAQLTGSVGPITSRADKAAIKVCNIVDYGAVADGATDISTAFADAWSDCASGGEVYIPPGDYALENWISVKDATGISVNLDGTIYRTGTAGGNMIYMRNVYDFEFYSSTSKGAIQAYGYEFHKDGEYGPRILRFYEMSNFSVHDIALVDSPQFHLSIDTCTNVEIYNTIIHGGYEGGLDGIDVWGDNIWIHDIEVSNKDECVTVKNPASNILIEQVHCNWSGGCAMGSLGTDTDIKNIEYRNIYTHHSNQMYMFKSNGGNGTVSNIVLDGFSGHDNAYTLDFDTAWSSMDVVEGDGIEYSNITFSSWTGTCEDGTERGPVKMNCPAEVPCYDITIEDFAVWTESGSEVYHGCQNAFGSGSCLDDSEVLSVFTSTSTLKTVAGYTYSTMYNELTTGFDISASIPIPTMPASFFPGLAPKSAILGSVTASSTVVASSSVASPSSSVSVAASSSVAVTSAASTSSAAITSSAVVASSSSVAVSSSVDVSAVSSVVSEASSAASSVAVSSASATATVSSIEVSSAATSAATSASVATGVSSGFPSGAPSGGFSSAFFSNSSSVAITSAPISATAAPSSVAATSTDDDCEDYTETPSATSAAASATASDDGEDCDDYTETASAAAATATASDDDGEDCDDYTETASATAAPSATASADAEDCDDDDGETASASATAAAAATTEAVSSLAAASGAASVSGDAETCAAQSTVTVTIGLTTVTVDIATSTPLTKTRGASSSAAAVTTDVAAASSSALTKSRTTVVSVVTVLPVPASETASESVSAILSSSVPTLLPSTAPYPMNATSPVAASGTNAYPTQPLSTGTGEDCEDEE